MLVKMLHLLQAAALGSGIILGTVATAHAASPTVWDKTTVACALSAEKAVA